MNLYPVAEIFTSPQGEGYWSGVLCTFIRLAGCNVGKPYTPEARNTLGLQFYQERCTAWDNNSFPCDTNYRKAFSLSVEEIMNAIEAPRMLLTGGEPLMHNVEPLLDAAFEKGLAVHIETSGTKLLDAKYFNNRKVWVAVSPKQGYLPHMLNLAHEVRVLVGKHTDGEKLMEEFKPWYETNKLFVSPINDEHSFDQDNTRKCLELQLKYKHLRISTQTHKILGCR